jgi:hypothetical protein
MNPNQSVSLQLRDYHIRLDTGQTINERIENIRELTEVSHSTFMTHYINFIV